MVARGAPTTGGRPVTARLHQRLSVHRCKDFRDNSHGGTQKPQPPFERETCQLFLDFTEEGMQGENLRVTFPGQGVGSGGEMLTEKVARLLMEGL